MAAISKNTSTDFQHLKIWQRLKSKNKIKVKLREIRHPLNSKTKSERDNKSWTWGLVSKLLLWDQVEVPFLTLIYPQIWIRHAKILLLIGPTNLNFPWHLFNHWFFFSLNYGAMGVVMGHELSHAFDDQVGCCISFKWTFYFYFIKRPNFFVVFTATLNQCSGGKFNWQLECQIV